MKLGERWYVLEVVISHKTLHNLSKLTSNNNIFKWANQGLGERISTYDNNVQSGCMISFIHIKEMIQSKDFLLKLTTMILLLMEIKYVVWESLVHFVTVVGC